MLFTASKKKWELKYYNQHFNNWNKGYLRYLNSKQSGKVFVQSDLPNILDQIKCEIQIYELNDWLHENKKQDDSFYELLKFKFPYNQLLQDFINSRTSDFGSRYFRMVALEIAYGFWKDEGSEYHPIPSKIQFYIPARRLWIYDFHTRYGKKLITQNYEKLRPGKVYNFSQLDMRLSGMLIAIGFRFKAIQPLEHKWVEVEYSDIEWEDLKIHEKGFYDV